MGTIFGWNCMLWLPGTDSGLNVFRSSSVPEGYHLVIIELDALSGTYLHRLLMDARFDDF